MIKKAVFSLMMLLSAFCPLFAEGRITPSVSIRKDNFSSDHGSVHNLNSLEVRVAAEHFNPSNAIWLGGEVGASSLIDQGKPWIFTGSKEMNGSGLDVEVSCGQMFCHREGSSMRFIPAVGVSYHGFWLRDNGAVRTISQFNARDSLASLFGGIECRLMQTSSTKLKAAVQVHGGTVGSGVSFDSPAEAFHLKTRATALGGALKLEGSRCISECFDITLSSYLRNYWIGKRSGTVSGREGDRTFGGSLRNLPTSEWLTWGVNAGCHFIF